MAGYDVMTEFPPGYKFVPTDVELVQHYLAKKVHYQRPVPSLAPLVEDIHAKEFYSKSPDILGIYLYSFLFIHFSSFNNILSI